MSDAYQPSPAMRVFGWLLALLGGVWVLLAGGCTLAFLVSSIASSGASAGELQAAMVFLGIGAVCILPGAGLLFGAWAILRKRRS